MLPRRPGYINATQSLNPDLRAQHAASVSGVFDGAAMMVPYPTSAQHLRTESEYQQAILEYAKQQAENAAAAASSSSNHHGTPPPPPPVRQPPTMLAAMQRPDLTPEARRKMLTKLAPQISSLEKKYKLVFSSDARRDPLHSSTNDFTIDVTADVLPTKVNGFELIGYSFPQAEWPIEPYENSMPVRYGWCPYPGSRAYGVVARTVDLSPAQASNPSWAERLDGERPEFGYNGPHTLLYADMPLVYNPVVRIQVLPASATHPKRVALTFARRVGTEFPTLTKRKDLVYAQLDGCGLQGVCGAFPGVYRITPASLEPLPALSQLPYMTRQQHEGMLPPEPLLRAREVFESDPDANLDLSSLRTLTVIDPLFVRYFQAGTSAHVSPTSPFDSLGTLHVRPPATATEFAALLSAQLRALVERRSALERARSAAVMATHLRSISIPLTGIEVEMVKPGGAGTGSSGSGSGGGALSSSGSQQNHSHRFHLNLAWSFEMYPMDVQRWVSTVLRQGGSQDSIDTMLMPLVAATSDDLALRCGLPKGTRAEYNDVRSLSAHLASRDPPLLRPELTTDVVAIADAASLDFYFQSLNTNANSTRFAPQTTPASLVFEIPLRDSANQTHNVQVPSGEYLPWTLAVAITNAIQANPALRPLRIAVTPSMLEHHGNSIAGYRFTSLSGATFALAFDTAALNALALAPSRLGYRSMAYAGQSFYDPKLLSVMDDPYAGFSSPICFPATELGLGIPSPLPTTPYILPAFNTKRLQIKHVALDSVAGSLALVPATTASLPPSSNITLALAKPALFHHHQLLRIHTSADATDLLLNNFAGVPETAGSGALGSQLFSANSTTPLPAGNGSFGGRNDVALSPSAILSILTLFHNPAATLDGRTLAQTMVELWGRAGHPYGTAAITAAQDGDYRIALAPATAASPDPLSLPTLAQVDSLLNNIANHTDTRGSFEILAEAMLRIINGPPNDGAFPGTLALNNTSVATQTLGSAIAAYANAIDPPLGSLLLDMAAVYTWKSATTVAPIVISATGPLPATLLQSQPYLVQGINANAISIQPAPGSAVDPTLVAVQQISETSLQFTLLPGCCVGDPALLNFTLRILEPGNFDHTLTISHAHEDGTSITYPITLVPGRRYMMSYDDATLTPAAPVMPGTFVKDVVVESGKIYFTVQHNAPGSSFTATFNPGPVTTTFTIADDATILSAKAQLIAAGYVISFGGRAVVDSRGTIQYPFDIHRALETLGSATTTATATASPEILLQRIIDANDPGILTNGTCTFAPLISASPIMQLNLELAPALGITSLAQLGDLLDTYRVATQLATSIQIARINQHPFSMDFTSRISRGLRPERMGLLEDEYSAATAGNSTMTSNSTLPALSWFSALPLGSIGSIVDIERSGSPYLLLSVQINGEPTPTPTTQRPDGVDTARIEYYDGSTTYGGSYLNYAHNANVISIADSHDPQLDRQIINATAYVQVGSDQTTLRMLDRQDDRSPVLFPTSTYVNWIRFVVMKPDGTLYNFHGRKTMIAVRFMSHPDNPNFIAAASEPTT